MTAKIIQLRDYKRKEENKQPDTAPSEIVPFNGEGIDGMIYESSLGFVAPGKDPA